MEDVDKGVSQFNRLCKLRIGSCYRKGGRFIFVNLVGFTLFARNLRGVQWNYPFPMCLPISYRKKFSIQLINMFIDTSKLLFSMVVPDMSFIEEYYNQFQHMSRK